MASYQIQCFLRGKYLSRLENVFKNAERRKKPAHNPRHCHLPASASCNSRTPILSLPWLVLPHLLTVPCPLNNSFHPAVLGWRRATLRRHGHRLQGSLAMIRGGSGGGFWAKAEGQDGRGLFRTNKLSLTALFGFPTSHLLVALGHVLAKPTLSVCSPQPRCFSGALALGFEVMNLLF